MPFKLIFSLPRLEIQGYQFWTRTDEDGYFSVYDIRTGDYNLYAWVPGFIGDYKCDTDITITPGFINTYKFLL